MTSRLLALLLLLFSLPACDSGEPNILSISQFEGPEGEAVVRHIIAHLPAMEPEVPKVYCVVKGSRLMAASKEFTDRMKDLKINFVFGDSLSAREPDHTVVDPVSGYSPITIVITEIKGAGAGKWTATAGWAYKKTWERRHYRLEKKGDTFDVTDTGHLDGNYGK